MGRRSKFQPITVNAILERLYVQLRRARLIGDHAAEVMLLVRIAKEEARP